MNTSESYDFLIYHESFFHRGGLIFAWLQHHIPHVIIRHFFATRCASLTFLFSLCKLKNRLVSLMARRRLHPLGQRIDIGSLRYNVPASSIIDRIWLLSSIITFLQLWQLARSIATMMRILWFIRIALRSWNTKLAQTSMSLLYDFM